MGRPLVSVELRQRVFSGAVMMIVALAGFYYSIGTSALLVAALGIGGVAEWVRLQKPRHEALLIALSAGAVAAMIATGYMARPALAAMLGCILMLALFVAAARLDFEKAGWVALGLPYMGGGCLALLAVRMMPDYGLGLMLYLLVVVWGTDIGAYFCGRAIGGPKLLPQVSPSKTWAGLLGGMASAAALAFIAGEVQHIRMPLLGAGLAMVLAAVAQLGDLFESYVKRRCGVKDSSHLIPGHGGILDRIDGLVFAALFLVLFQTMVGDDIQWW